MTDYLDNNLSQIEKTAFAAHLQKCESCSEELRRQQHWLQHLSDINDSHADLSEQDRARMQEQIMMTIRSNEQAVRAAGYINQYKKDVEDKLGPVGQENTPADIINKKKSAGFLAGFTRYAGYAAVLVLLIAVGILFHDRTMTELCLMMVVLKVCRILVLMLVLMRQRVLLITHLIKKTHLMRLQMMLRLYHWKLFLKPGLRLLSM
jgi:hypothetical protein